MENNPQSISGIKTHRLILFIFGMSPKSVDALENLNHICEHYLKGKVDLQIIDISRDKELAQQYQIIAIPTLIKLEPSPQRMILGDLSNKAKVLKLLEIPDTV